MLNNISISRYVATPSLIHKMNSLVKIICTIIFVILTFLANEWIFFGILTILLLISLISSQITVLEIIKIVLSIKWLLLILIIFNIILGIDSTSTVMMSLRLIFIVLSSSVLIITTRTKDLTSGLEKLLYPLKYVGLPVSKMAFSISLALNFIPMILDQGNKILRSQASRGIDYHQSNVKGKFVAVKSLIIPMITSSIRRADCIADTMDIRLYDINRSYSPKLTKWTNYDYLYMLIYILILVLYIFKGVF